MKNHLFKIVLSIIVVLVVLLLVNSLYITKEHVVVDSFETCIKSTNTVLESYPRQCITSSGEKFTEYIGNELEMAGLIRVNTPRPNQIISNPLYIQGLARGYWFFEADAPVYLYDDNNNLLTTGIATVNGDWMTEDFVEFTSELKFEVPSTKKGLLILKNDNPSGLKENSKELIIPIIFE